MMRVLQVTIFLGLSAAVHAAVLVGVPGMGAEGAGENGTAQASIAASSARAQSLVQDWTRPPETGQIQGAFPQAVSVARPSRLHRPHFPIYRALTNRRFRHFPCRHPNQSQ